MRDVSSLFDQTKTSRPKQRLRRNITAAPGFTPSLLSLCPLMDASPRQSALGRFAPHVSGHPNSSPG